MPIEATFAHRRQLAKQLVFLSHFAKSGSVLASAKLAGVSRQLVYYWRDTSPSFAAKLSDAADVAFKGTTQIQPPNVSKVRHGVESTKSARRARP